MDMTSPFRLLRLGDSIRRVVPQTSSEVNSRLCARVNRSPPQSSLGSSVDDGGILILLIHLGNRAPPSWIVTLLLLEFSRHALHQTQTICGSFVMDLSKTPLVVQLPFVFVVQTPTHKPLQYGFLDNILAHRRSWWPLG